MEVLLTQFANATADGESSDMFSAIGIDWTMLLFQTIAFVILLLILKRWVYPPLMKMLDKRDEDIKASADAAIDAERHAAEAEARTAKLLEDTKKEAHEIIATAHEEATQSAEAIHAKAESRAEAMVKSARDEISKEIEVAKKDLKSETLELVALATGKVLEGAVNPKIDNQVIQKALEESK